MLFKVCKAILDNLIALNQDTTEIKNKIDVFYAANKLTEEEYNILSVM